MKSLYYFLVALVMTNMSCDPPEQLQADLVIKNGNIYTVNDQQPVVEAVAVNDGRIVFIGSNVDVEAWVTETTEVIDLEGKTMTPGWIEGHGHIMGLGWSELNLDVSQVANYDELVDKVAEAAAQAEPGEWILGRGWHQDKWDKTPDQVVKGFQTHHKLSAVSPDNPVYLGHASGHAGFANAKAMEIAGLNQLSIESFSEQLSEGGEIIVDELGNPTGIFNELAQGLIRKHIPETSEERRYKALELAIAACQRNGITSFHDAGTGRDDLELFRRFRDEGKLGVRIYCMLTGRDPELLDEWFSRGPEVDTAQHLLDIRAVKLNADGALGSRGAWLLQSYADREDHVGHATIPMDYVLEVSLKGLETGFQINSHAIGDRANREILNNYELAMSEFPEVTDHRFRIEHSQHLSLEDIPRFAELGVIASMQAIHMSSDRPWAIDRLGERRIVEGAYVWQKLLQSGAKIVNGTDVPVEPIDPIACFYASVTRKTLKGEPEGGYEPDQRMTRAQALKSYTLDAAYGEFNEGIKGSIEIGKLADFTVFSQDIMSIPENEILNTSVVMTIFDGKVVYDQANL